MSDLFYDESFDFFEFEVSEKIEDKNIKKFFLSSLKLKNLLLKKSDKLYFNYIEELKLYQIFILKHPFKQFEFLIFQQFYKESNQEISFDLYIYDKFFCLYKNSNFYYFQNLQIEISTEEFISYLNSKFKIQIDNLKKIEKEELSLLKQNYQKNPKKIELQTINYQKNYAFKLYLFFIILLFSSILFQNNNAIEVNKIEQNTLNIEEIKKSKSFISLEKKIVPLLDSLIKNRANLIKFEYSSNELKLTINSTSKENIYTFLDENKSFIANSSLKYFEDKNLYEAIIYVYIFRQLF